MIDEWTWKGYEQWERGNRMVAKIAPGLFSATLRGFRGDVIDATNYATPRDAMNAADRLTARVD